MRSSFITSLILHLTILIIVSIQLRYSHDNDSVIMTPEIPVELIAEKTGNPNAGHIEDKKEKEKEEKKKNEKEKIKKKPAKRKLDKSIKSEKLKAYSNPKPMDETIIKDTDKTLKELDRAIKEIPEEIKQEKKQEKKKIEKKPQQKKDEVTIKKQENKKLEKEEKEEKENQEKEKKSEKVEKEKIEKEIAKAIAPKLKPKQFMKSPAQKREKKQTKNINSILKNLQKVESSINNNEKNKNKSSINDEIGGPYGDKLGLSEIDSIKRQIERCWEIPAGARNAHSLVIDIELKINKDGRVISAEIVNKPLVQDEYYKIASESAKRAVLHPRCRKLRLPAAKYKYWKHMVIRFNPSEML